MELKEIVSLYRRWIGLILAGLVLGLALGFLASKIQTPVYEATAKVLVARNHQQDSPDILSLSDQQLVVTYQNLLKTPTILDAAGTKLGFKINPDNVRVDVPQYTQIIQITVNDTNASRAVQTANALVQLLIDQNETLQGGRYATYEDGLNSQLAKVQQQIQDLQAQINQLDQANIQEQLAQVKKQIASLQDEIVKLEQDIAKSPEALSSIGKANLAQKQAEVDQLRSLLLLYQQIQTNLTYLGQPAQAGGASHDPQVTSLQSTLNLYQSLYLNLLNNLESVKLARAQSTPTISQIQPATPSEGPIRPLPLLYTALGGMIGLLLAAGAILLIDYFDDSFHTARRAQELLHAPVIGQVAEFGAAPRKWFSWPVRGGLKDAGEWRIAFGSLRMNLFRLLARSPRKSVLITSAWRGEGKTTVCANLARSFAQAGKRVILVDADLARPQIHAEFGLENQVGLTDILTNGVDWQEVSCTQDRVTILTSGSPSVTSSGLLESEKMTDLLDRMQRRADIIIVDGPPLFVPDAQALASQLGGIVLVIQQGTTKTGVAHSVGDQLELMGVPLLGIVLNRVPQVDSYYFDARLSKALEEKPKVETETVEPA